MKPLLSRYLTFYWLIAFRKLKYQTINDKLVWMRADCCSDCCSDCWENIDRSSYIKALYTVECRYNAVQYNTIFHTAPLHWLTHNMNQTLNSQKTFHTSPSQASYGASFVRVREKIDRVITAPYCNTKLHITQARLDCIHDIVWKHMGRSAPADSSVSTQKPTTQASLEEHRLKLYIHYYWKTRASINNPSVG